MGSDSDIELEDDTMMLTLPSMAGAAPSGDELETYLEEPCEIMPDAELFDWWRRRADKFPRLSRMALNYLTAPGTSIGCDIFSLTHVCR